MLKTKIYRTHLQLVPLFKPPGYLTIEWDLFEFLLILYLISIYIMSLYNL